MRPRVWDDLTAFAVAWDRKQLPLVRHWWSEKRIPAALALEMRRCISIHDVRASTMFCILARQIAQPANVIVLANLFICCAVTLYRSPQTVCQS
ncbi:hypothetical protein N7466_001537 [Penicillium verhagenii]|uniref:uncharacterized protein n=1 Tax=Penicillium verhagenii TaxID=1562060 RepID=UPI002545A81B|nr:uncharacterized protein N7466_001537 [Penicillium verhagenii]KAJ5938403.1 hypothetical protein N7466_001537 [Penicillium verhagenii]